VGIRRRVSHRRYNYNMPPPRRDLLISTAQFQAMWDEIRTFDVQPDQISFCVGDWLLFREDAPAAREMSARITFVEPGPGVAVLAVKIEHRGKSSRRMSKA